MSGVIDFQIARRPHARHVLRLWTRPGSIDCITEGGSRDPLGGGTTIAIPDIGPHQPIDSNAARFYGRCCREIPMRVNGGSGGVEGGSAGFGEEP